MRSEVRILLCGGTGVGKSAVGNTILGSKQFVCGTRPHPVTQVFETGTTLNRGRKITVIDTPSTEEPELEAEFQRCASLSESPPEIFLLVTPLGFHGGKALRVLNTLQKVFSGHEVDQFTIVLFTGGDRLEEMSENQKKHNNDSELNDLLARCGNRQHTFNNNEADDQTQVLQLFAKINQLLQKNKNLHSRPKKRSVEEAEEAAIWNWPEYKTHLPVICGSKKGVLHRDKMAKGEECIEVNGSWFTPTRFEAFAGKGSTKKWKSSIRCQDVPLSKLILAGFPMWAPDGSLIETGDFKVILTGVEGEIQGRILEEKMLGKTVNMDDIKMATLQESSLTVTYSTVESTPQKNYLTTSESRRDSKVKVQKKDASHGNEGKISPLKKEVLNKNATKKFDMAVFQESSLPVTCGTAQGILQKNRFSSGTTGKCIRTASCWMTPEEFVLKEAGLESGNWRRDVNCHGKAIAILIEEGHLQLHSVLCACDVCRSEDPLDQNNDDLCFICGQDTELVCCDGCPRSFHHACHLPTLGQNLGDRWMCTFCIVEKSKELCQRTLSLEEALNSTILPNMLQCQYLLLYLLKEDKKLVFMQDPCRTFDNYAAVISKPMWIDKIMKRLRDKYSTVGQFVADVQLMFTNCAAFNKNNKYGRMGARLHGLFEEKLRSVFSIK